MSLVFVGTGAFGVPSLRALVHAGRAPALVVTAPDRPAGRDRRPMPCPLAAAASELGLPLFQPERVSRPEGVARLAALAPEVVVVVSYGQILKPAVLALPKRGCVNVHGSLLPRHRGASPVQAAILAGDRETGVTIMLMDEGLDTGPTLLAERTPIGPEETGGALHDRLAELGAPLLLRALVGLESGALRPVPQDSSLATSCGLIEKRHGQLDFGVDAALLARRVRAYSPWPGAFTEFEVRGTPLRVVVLAASAQPSAGGAPPGTVIAADAAGLVVACGDGALRLSVLKPAGKNPQTAAEFLRGYPLAVGARALVR